MGKYNKAVLTAAGLLLNAKVQAGTTNITFTRAATGDGDYQDGESLVTRTNLKSERQTVGIDGVSVENKHTARVRFNVLNHTSQSTLRQGYYIKEVGLFAEDPDVGEILYAMATAVRDQWDYMPAYDSTFPAENHFDFMIEAANADQVTIIGPPMSDYVTHPQLESRIEMHNLDEASHPYLLGEISKLKGMIGGAVLEVNVPEESTITVTGVDYEEVQTGEYARFLIHMLGDYHVKVEAGGKTKEVDVEIYEVKLVRLTLAYFSATINVTSPVGAPVYCQLGTDEPLVGDTTGSNTFTLYNSGTWKVWSELGDEYAEKTVEITTDGQEENVTLEFSITVNLTVEGAVEDTIIVTTTDVATFEDIDVDNTIAMVTFETDQTTGQVEITCKEGTILRFWSTVADLSDEGHWYTDAEIVGG